MMNPVNRKLRAEVFKKLDPNNEYQKIGYDYLYDESGLQLETMPEGREFDPKPEDYTFTVPEQYLYGQLSKKI